VAQRFEIAQGKSAAAVSTRARRKISLDIASGSCSACEASCAASRALRRGSTFSKRIAAAVSAKIVVV